MKKHFTSIVFHTGRSFISILVRGLIRIRLWIKVRVKGLRVKFGVSFRIIVRVWTWFSFSISVARFRN